MAIHSMRWIAYFFALFFLVGCDNSESEEDLELIKEQTDIIHHHNQHLYHNTIGHLIEHNLESTKWTQLKKGFQIYNCTFDSSNSNLSSLDANLNQLNLATDYHNSLYTKYPTEEIPKRLADSNFLIRTTLTNNNDSLEIELYIGSQRINNFKFHQKKLTPNEIIDKIDRKIELKALLKINKHFSFDKRKESLELHNLFYSYLKTYNNIKLSTENKSKVLNQLEHKLYTYEWMRMKDSVQLPVIQNPKKLKLQKMKFLNFCKGIFGSSCFKFANEIPNTHPKLYTIIDYEYLIKKASLINNISIPIRHLNKGYYTIKLATKDIKTDHIQLDVEFEQEYGKPKHYKTNKVPFKITEQ